MNRSLRFQFIVIVVLTIGALHAALHRIRPGIDLAGGAELRYKVLFPPGFTGDRQQATRQATDVIRRRLETSLLREPKINSHGDNGIVIQLAGVDAEGSAIRQSGDIHSRQMGSRIGCLRTDAACGRRGRTNA